MKEIRFMASPKMHADIEDVARRERRSKGSVVRSIVAGWQSEIERLRLERRDGEARRERDAAEA